MSREDEGEERNYAESAPFTPPLKEKEKEGLVD